MMTGQMGVVADEPQVRESQLPRQVRANGSHNGSCRQEAVDMAAEVAESQVAVEAERCMPSSL